MSLHLANADVATRDGFIEREATPVETLVVAAYYRAVQDGDLAEIRAQREFARAVGVTAELARLKYPAVA